jgi:hypothetical protein
MYCRPLVLASNNTLQAARAEAAALEGTLMWETKKTIRVDYAGSIDTSRTQKGTSLIKRPRVIELSNP